MRKVTEYLKYTFTQAETEAHSQELARQIQALQRLEDQRKEVVANLKAQIEAASGTARDLSQKITNGYEYRNIECEVMLNTPARGRKSIYRLDTNAFVREMAMTADELQGDLPLDGESGEGAADKPSRGPKVTHRSVDIGGGSEAHA